MSNPLCSRCKRRIKVKETYFEYFCLLFDKDEESIIPFSGVEDQLPIALNAAFHWVGREATQDTASARFSVINTLSEATGRINRYKRILTLFIKIGTPEGISGSKKAWEESNWHLNDDGSTFFFRKIRFDDKSQISIMGWASDETKFNFSFRKEKSLVSNMVSC